MSEIRPGRFEILPLIIKNLLIINGLVFLAQNTFESNWGTYIEQTFALHSWSSPLFKPWQLITHMFMHGDFGHLVGNMFALWMFGSVLENLWGAKRFFTFYMVCGLGAAFIHLLFLYYEIAPLTKDMLALKQAASDSSLAADAIEHFIRKYNLYLDMNPEAMMALEAHQNNPELIEAFTKVLQNYYLDRLNTATLGASGAVFGVLAGFVYLFPNTYIYLYFFVPVKAKWLGLIYFGYEVFFALRNSAGDNIARWAHIGGALVGLLIVLTWNKNNKKTFY